MDKQRTENMSSDNTELNIKDVRSSHISEEDNGYISTPDDIRESQLNEANRLANQRSQKNAEHDAIFGDASGGDKSRLPEDQQPEDAHVPQG